MITAPFRTDLLQKGLVEALESAFDSPPLVAWTYGQGLYEAVGADGMLALRVMAGPDVVNRRKAHGGKPFVPHADYEITVDAVTVGELVALEVNDRRYDTEVEALDTPETVRDRLIALFGDDSDVFTAVANGSDAFDLTPTALGRVHQLRLVRGLTLSGFTAQPQAFEAYQAANAVTVEIQAFSKAREPRNGAVALAAVARAALQDDRILQTLAGYGFGVWGVTTPTDISSLAGGHWETRSVFLARLASRAHWARPVDQIEQVKRTFTTS